jgi:hypothetical protein
MFLDHTQRRTTVGRTPDDGQKTCPKHVEFYSKNKFEKLVHLVGFIIRIHFTTFLTIIIDLLSVTIIM